MEGLEGLKYKVIRHYRYINDSIIFETDNLDDARSVCSAWSRRDKAEGKEEGASGYYVAGVIEA